MATDASRDIRKQLNIMTECAVCTETYSDPRVLPCVHTYCLRCIKQLCKDKPPRAEVACPLCRRMFEIPGSGVDGLPKNYLVEQLKDAADMAGKYCEICSDETDLTREQSATHICVECGQIMCKTCANGHRRTRATRSHNLVEIGDCEDVRGLLVKVASRYCESHRDDVLKFYCFDCKVTICVTCFVEMHNTHKCSDVNKTADEFRIHMKDDIGNLVKATAKCREIIGEQKMNKNEFSCKVAEIEREIRDRAERLKELVDRERDDLLEEVGRCHKERTKQTDHVINETEQHISFINSLVRYAEELMKLGTASDVTQQTGSVRARVGELLTIDVLQRSISDLGLFDVTFRPATSPTELTGKLIGQVHRNECKALTLKHVLPGGEGGVVGLTSLKGQLIVLRDPSKQQIEVYSTSRFKLLRTLQFRDLSNECTDLASCSNNNCLYVSDSTKKAVWKINLHDNKICKLIVSHKPWGLSVTTAGNVIVTSVDYNIINEYNARGSLIREISLSSDITRPRHAIQFREGHLVVSHWQPVPGVSKVDSVGQRLVNVNNPSTQLLDVPGHLTVYKNDWVLVTDSGNDRVMLLNPSLSCARVLPLFVDGGLQRPYRLHFDEENDRLYVGEVEGKRVLVFDNVSNIDAYVC